MTDVEFCYFAALIDGLRLIDGKAREKKIELEDVDVTALSHYVHSVGDKLVNALTGESLELHISEPRPSRPQKHISRGFVPTPIHKLLPYAAARKFCTTEGCSGYHWAKGLCFECDRRARALAKFNACHLSLCREK